MPAIDERWRQVSDESWERLAIAWLEELRQPKRSNESCTTAAAAAADDQVSSDEEDYGDIVVRMNFTADSFLQWTFIEAAMRNAEERDLGHIAAGPVEHLLGWHGDEYVDRVEACVREDPKWRQMIRKAWRYRMTDEVWGRVQILQSLDD